MLKLSPELAHYTRQANATVQKKSSQGLIASFSSPNFCILFYASEQEPMHGLYIVYIYIYSIRIDIFNNKIEKEITTIRQHGDPNLGLQPAKRFVELNIDIWPTTSKHSSNVARPAMHTTTLHKLAQHLFCALDVYNIFLIFCCCQRTRTAAV